MIKRICLYIFLFLFFVLNIIIIGNIKNYIEIINICFNQNIVLSNKLYACICSIIVLISVFIILDILLVIYKKKDENKGIKFKPEDGTFGTSDWMKIEEIKEVLSIKDVPGIILGKYNDYIVKLPLDSYFNKNIGVFGSSR